MKRNTLNRSVTLLLLLIFTACKIKKEVVLQQSSSPDSSSQVVSSSQPASNITFSKTETLDKVIAKQANFNTLSIRAKANLDINNNANNVSMTIRIQKDKAIWISVTAIAGLEVARALITPDSLKVLNRIESVYIKKSFGYIYEFTNRQLNFNTLQAIFAGNAMPEFLNDKSMVNISGKALTLSGMLNNLIYSLTFNENFNLIQTDLKDESAGQTMTVAYEDFISVSQQIIPHSVSIKSNAEKKNIRIDLKYNRVDIDAPVDLPFSIPQRFTVKD
jgi:hypothetical protein